MRASLSSKSKSLFPLPFTVPTAWRNSANCAFMTGVLSMEKAGSSTQCAGLSSAGPSSLPMMNGPAGTNINSGSVTFWPKARPGNNPSQSPMKRNRPANQGKGFLRQRIRSSYGTESLKHWQQGIFSLLILFGGYARDEPLSTAKASNGPNQEGALL